MTPRLRILMLSQVPHMRELGAGRVQLELADELRALGHVVETFDVRDAFPGGVRRRRLRPIGFAARARAFVKSEGARFDVIDALQGALPYDKQELDFSGLLVSRSVGLFAFYRDFAQYAARRWPDLLPGTRPGQLARRIADHRLHRLHLESIRKCDVALFLTDDEVAWARRELGPSERWVALPNGLTDTHADALRSARSPGDERLRRSEVSFIGTWDLRKGVADWPMIAHRIRSRVASLRLLMLGVGPRQVPDLGPGVNVVPSFTANALPALLSKAAVGLSPSYAEGWGLGILEQLAAGIPTVAYDASGPRTMLEQVDARLLVRRGDALAAADRAADLLELSSSEYDELSSRCVAAAAQYRWSGIAQRTAELYFERVAGAAS